jgi:HEAT repeat protein
MTNNTSAHQLIKELYSLDPIRQIVAISQIKDLDIKSAIPDLIKLLSSPEEDVRWLVVEALADITNFEDELTAKALAQMLFDSSSLVRCDTIYALSDLNYKLAREKIEDLLINDPDWLVRVAAAETLANLADKGNISSISKLADALNDPISPLIFCLYYWSDRYSRLNTNQKIRYSFKVRRIIRNKSRNYRSKM